VQSTSFMINLLISSKLLALAIRYKMLVDPEMNYRSRNWW
jgi:hypothetical protein